MPEVIAMSPDFTPLPALIGGLLIGASASAMLLVHGKIAGCSSIFGELFDAKTTGKGWRLAFVSGLVAAGLGAAWWAPALLANETNRSTGMLVAAGLLVGVGTRLGGGCTSGHGVCGLSRLSPRSLASVVTFFGVAMVVATAVGQLLGHVP